MNLIEILETLPDSHIVGGAIRDLFMNRTPHDYDIVTSALPHEISTLLPCKSYDVGGAKFGTVIVNTDDVGQVEITTLRRDLTGGRHPSVEFTKNIKEDLARRDFTCNAIAIDINNNIIDPFNGITAIKNKEIIPVIPNETFTITKGDPLRVLRAIRFRMKLGFTIPSHAELQMKNADLSTLSGERIYMELEKMMENTSVTTFIYLQKYDALHKILPEVSALQYCVQNRTHHPEGNAYKHTLLALTHVTNEPMLTKMAVLLHDIGKPFSKIGITYHGHDKLGVPIAESIMKRLGRPKHEVKAVSFVVENHMRIHNLDKMRPGKRRNLYENPNFELLLKVNEADTSMRPMDKFKPRTFYENDIQTRTNPIKPLLDGHELMTHGLRGVEIGLTTKEIIELQVSGEIVTKEDAQNFITKILNNR